MYPRFERDPFYRILNASLDIRNLQAHYSPTMVPAITHLVAVRIDVMSDKLGFAAVLASIYRLIWQLERGNVYYLSTAFVMKDMFWFDAAVKLLIVSKIVVDCITIPQHFWRNFMHFQQSR